MGGRIRTDVNGHVGRIVFDHPDRRNAITHEMWEEIPPAVEAMAADPHVRVVVMRGEGEEAFVSGADISEFERARSGPHAADYDRSNQKAFASLANLEKPLIAFVHGFCVGGGCAIALMADLRYSADDGVFGIPAARLGLGYHADGIQALVEVVGQAAAKEIFFTARRFTAEEARRLGIVHRVVPKKDLDGAVSEIARAIAENAPLTLRSAKIAFREMAKDSSIRDNGAIADSIRRCYESADYAEGVRAFLEKRRPRFRGV